MSLYHGHVRVDIRSINASTTLLSAKGNLNDGLWHFVSVSLNPTRLFRSLTHSLIHSLTHSLTHFIFQIEFDFDCGQ